ncbi:hypothetical protein [Sinorhizobium alkalisoli]|uniref:Uncharacterized protein n=1 Tax=Sinorhizobium alkalisoli TaxID=1752398 RepID=A0A1E3VAL9_9HYPH|nr:hypothetical protein [Sinorhizobium alkalisoli]MCA1492485.1 hypothetical protein [Ensifer sp. NBAIM29]ODR90639.1 hypothetical protein A8M32_15090 [Sinorhizobium alkalisoli]
MNAQKIRKLVEDCRRDLSEYLSPESGISDREIVIALLYRLDGPQAKDALGEDFDYRPPTDNSRTAEPAGTRPNEARLRIIFGQTRKCP